MRLWLDMSKEIQPTMDRQVRATKRLFNDIGKDEIDRIMRNAMRQTDRYRALKNDGASDEEIMSEFKKPVKMKVFSYKGERDTTMSPYDSILYHKQILRASFMADRPFDGICESLRRRSELPLFQIRHGQAGQAPGGFDDQAVHLYLCHRAPRTTIPARWCRTCP